MHYHPEKGLHHYQPTFIGMKWNAKSSSIILANSDLWFITKYQFHPVVHYFSLVYYDLVFFCLDLNDGSRLARVHVNPISFSWFLQFGPRHRLHFLIIFAFLSFDKALSFLSWRYDIFLGLPVCLYNHAILFTCSKFQTQPTGNIWHLLPCSMLHYLLEGVS